MPWSKPEKTSWGGYRSEKEGFGTLYSSDSDGKSIDHHNHVHFHDDGVTIKKDGKEYTVPKPKHGLKKIQFPSGTGFAF